MKDSLKSAKENFIKRWIDAYGEINLYYQYKEQSVSFKYADSFSYDLKGFKNGKIKAGSKVYNHAPKDDVGYGRYGFNKDGFVSTAEIYSNGKLSWIGFFKKDDHLIEYLEFDVERKVPVCIKSIFFENSKKAMYLSASTNGRMGFYATGDISTVKMVKEGFDDGHSVICTIEEYKYEGDIINRAYGLNIMPGGGEYAFEDVYIYNEGRLKRIKTYLEDGKTYLKYIAPSNKKLAEIMQELSVALSDYLISSLKKIAFHSPLFCIELSYQYCYTYWPGPAIITEEQMKNAILNGNKFLLYEAEFINVTEEVPPTLDELYKEFYQRIETGKNWEAGRRMLIQTARLMTSSKLLKQIPVTEDFIVFPIEWELEGDELTKILLKCGASKSNIKNWRQSGLLA